MKETELPQAFEKVCLAFAEIQAKYEQVERENTQLKTALAEALEREVQAVAEKIQLQEVVGQLGDQVKQLEARAAKASHNSSKPPSSDGFKEPVRKTQSLRGKSGKKSGDQPGHEGKTLLMVEKPDAIRILQPERCQRCQHDLCSVSPIRMERYQVFDLPKLDVQVTEYQAHSKVCPCCQTETRAPLPDGLSLAASAQYGPQIKALAVYLATQQLLPVKRVSDLLTDLFGCTLSQATVLAACQQSAQALAPVIEHITRALQKSRVLHNDETGFRVEKKRWWLHVACTLWYTLYLAHPKRATVATDAMAILPGYQGISVHDTLALYLHYPCVHALCVVHYLRELTWAHEQFHQHRATQMKMLLRTIHLQVEHAREAGTRSLSEQDQQEYRRRDPRTRAHRTGRQSPSNRTHWQKRGDQKRGCSQPITAHAATPGPHFAFHDQLRGALYEQSGGIRSADDETPSKDFRLLSLS